MSNEAARESLAEEVERLREALRESEHRFEAFMTNSPALAFIKDAHGRFLYVNRRYLEVFGISEGGFCPSPSMVATTEPRASVTPLRTAADWPAIWACCSSRTIGKRWESARTRAAVASVEPSSTTITS